MSLFDVMLIFVMGMYVESVCLNIIVSNIVNVNIVSSSEGDIYWVCYVVFVVELQCVFGE